MAWYEISVKTKEACIDAVSGILYTLGANGIQIVNPNDPDLNGNASGLWDFFEPENTTLDFDGVLMTAYFDIEEAHEVEGFIKSIEKQVADLRAFDLPVADAEVLCKGVNPQDWENEWKKYFKPFRLGHRMVVKPSWESFDVKPGDLVIEIDPGNAFGSGTHETTSLCIEALEKYLSPGFDVIDVGCGSGILSIAAGLLDAKSVLGIDIDGVAVKTAKENVALNGLEHLTQIKQGDLIAAIDHPADVVVANIIADVIVMLVDDVTRVMKKDALFIAYGIILNKLSEVEAKLIASDFQIVETIVKGEWAVVVSKRKEM